MPEPDRDEAGAAVQVRSAAAGDVAALVDLLVGGSLVAKEDPSDLAPYHRALEEIGRSDSNELLVAELDGNVVGMCQLFFFRHFQERGRLCAEIESMHVRADLRSRGIGALIVAEAVERARAAGCYRVQLTSNQARGDAHRFWTAQGFTASHLGFKLYLDGPGLSPR
jgi:GNAT superfamily N-acetyltransferase